MLHCIQLSYLGNVVTVALSVTIVFGHQTTLQLTLPFPWSFSPLLLSLFSSHCCILFFIQPSVSTLSNHQTCLSVSRFLAALYLLVLEVTNMTNMNSLKAVFCFAVCYLATLSSGVGKFCLIPSPTRHPIWSVLP